MWVFLGLFLLFTNISTGKGSSPILNITGCSCDFDPLQLLIDSETEMPFSCACCKNGAEQCGYPMHNSCKYKFQNRNKGCNGIENFEYTLSQLGGPCPEDRTNRTCAICAPGK